MQGDAEHGPTGRRVTRRGEIRRRAILDVAIGEFAATGYRGGSMRAIARQANVEFALVQHHFGDKLGLWDAVINDILADLRADLTRALARSEGRPAAERLAVELEALIRHGASHPGFIGVMSHARLDSSPDARAFQARLKPMVDELVAMIAAAQADGTMAPANPLLTMYQMVGAALRPFMTKADLAAYSSLDPRAAAVLDEHIRMCVRLFLPTVEQNASGAWTVAGSLAPFGPAAAREAPPDPRATEPIDPSSSLFHLLKAVDALATRRLDAVLVQHGVDARELVVLSSIQCDGPSSSTKLAATSGLSRRALTSALGVLEKTGLVRRDALPQDPRGPQVALTSAGRSMLNKAWRSLRAADAELLADLAFEERSMFMDLLRRVLAGQGPGASSD